MAAKELKRMNRSELLQLLIVRSREAEELQAQVELLKTELEACRCAPAPDRSLTLENAGSLSDAFAVINSVYADAQRSAQQYLASLERMRQEQELAGARLLAEAQEKADAMLTETRQKCALMEADARSRCDELRRCAEQDAQHNWDELTRRLDQLSSNNAELRTMLTSDNKKRKWRL